MKPNNDNAHVILEEDRAGNVRPVLAPLPASVLVDTRCEDCSVPLVNPVDCYVGVCLRCCCEREEKASRIPSFEALLGAMRKRAA